MSSAHEMDGFRIQLSTGIVSSLSKGPHFLSLQDKPMRLNVRTAVPFSLANSVNQAVPCLITGQIRIPEGVCGLELNGVIKQGHIESDLNLADVELALAQWRTNNLLDKYSKTYQATFNKLKFHEEEGFFYEMKFSRQFPYVAHLLLRWDQTNKSLTNVANEFEELAAFCKKFERRLHGRVLLANNESGLPSRVYKFQDNNGQMKISIHHPMHRIFYDLKTKQYGFDYLTRYSKVAALPEIKKLMSNNHIAELVNANPGEARVHMIGGKKEGFVFKLTQPDLSKDIRGKIIKNKIQIEP